MLLSFGNHNLFKNNLAAFRMVIFLTDEQKYAVGSVQYMQGLILSYVRDRTALPVEPLHEEVYSSLVSRKKHNLPRVPVRLYRKKLSFEFASEEDANLVQGFINCSSCQSNLVAKVRKVVNKTDQRDKALLTIKDIKVLLVPDVLIYGENSVMLSYNNLMLPEHVIEVL